MINNMNYEESVGTSAPLPKGTKKEVLTELMKISKSLGETIRVSTIRKIHVDNLIKQLTKGQKVEEQKIESYTAESSSSEEF
jgi:hypothetical protein